MLIIILICLGLIPAFIAKSKGRDFIGWWVYGTFLFIVALAHSLLIRSNRNCPSCGESVGMKAIICNACGGDLQHDPADADDAITRRLIETLQKKP